jgi:hypothetical protein
LEVSLKEKVSANVNPEGNFALTDIIWLPTRLSQRKIRTANFSFPVRFGRQGRNKNKSSNCDEASIPGQSSEPPEKKENKSAIIRAALASGWSGSDADLARHFDVSRALISKILKREQVAA